MPDPTSTPPHASNRESTPEDSRISRIVDLPAVITLLTFVSLLLSVVHEAVYFSILSFALLSVVSPSDFLRLAIFWLPFAALAFTVIVAAGAVVGRPINNFESTLNTVQRG